MSDLITYPDGTKYRRSGECDGCKGLASCCTYLSLPLARELTKDETRWAELHPGIIITGLSVRIEIACSALEGGKCTLFGSPERPVMCERYPELPGLDDRCSYTFEKVE